jgi:hypothetical protein
MAIINFFFCLHGDLHHTAMLTFSSPQGNDRLFLCLTAVSLPHGDSSGSHPPHSFLRLTAICLFGRYHHQFGLTAVSLLVVVSSISPHRRTPLDNIIFYLALLVILSSILPHGRAPPGILFSIQSNGNAILAKYFSIWTHGCASPGKILLITHQGF